MSTDKMCFENTQPGHNKFWTVENDGLRLHFTYGKIGSSGVTQVKTFASVYDRDTERGKKCREKSHKGYRIVPRDRHPGSNSITQVSGSESHLSAHNVRSPAVEDRFLDI